MEQLLARSTRVQVYDDDSPEGYSEDDYDDEAEIRIRQSSGRIGFFGTGGTGASGSLARRRLDSRTGSSLGSSEGSQGMAEAKGEDRNHLLGSPKIGSGTRSYGEMFGPGTGGEPDMGSGPPERRPLLGRAKSSYKIRVRICLEGDGWDACATRDTA